MSTLLQRHIAVMAGCIALAIIPAVSHADDGSDGGGDYNFPASNVLYEPATSMASPSCADAKRTAWFNRQVEISDGDVSPAIPMPAECDRRLVAKADTDDTK